MKSLTLTIVFITLAAFMSSLQPIVTSIAFHYSTARNPINFGMSRSFGSVSYAAMTSILGAMVYKYGTNAIPTAGIIILFLLIVSLLTTASISKKAVIEADIDNIDLNKMQKSQQKISLAEFIYLMFIIKTKNIFNIHIWCCHKVILICFYDYKDKQFFLNASTFIKKLYAHQYNLFRKTE